MITVKLTSRININVAGTFGPGGAWLYNDEWEIDNRGNLADLNDQVLLTLTTENFGEQFALAKANGADLRFYSGPLELKHRIVSYDGLFSALIWVTVRGISAGQLGTIKMYYGNPAAASTSSFADTMRRFQPTEDDTEYLVRFNDGSGTTPANIGASGGTMTITGGKTWNTNNIWGETGGSLTLDGISGQVFKTGLLDIWPETGSLHFKFPLNSAAEDQTIFSKVNRLGAGGGDEGDFVQLFYQASSGKIALRLYCGASQKITKVGETVMATGTVHSITLAWNTKLSTTYGGWMIVWMNCSDTNYGREIENYAAISYPPAGSACPFRIGAMSNSMTGVAESFASITLNDFAYQSSQMLWQKVVASHMDRNYYMKDEKSKLQISRVPAWGDISQAYPSEPCGFYENGNIYVLYSFFDETIFSLRIRQTVAANLQVNVAPTWTNDRKLLGGGTGGESGTAIRGVIGRSAGILYVLHRDASSAGIVYICSSADTDLDTATFSNKRAILTPPVSGPGQYGFFNTSFPVFINGYWRIVADYLDTGGINIYLAVVARCLTIDGTYEIYGTNPKMGLVPGDGSGLVGGPSTFFNTVYNLFSCWLGASPIHPASGSLPNDLYRADSDDDGDTWTNSEIPVVVRELPEAYDQKSDPGIIEPGGTRTVIFTNDIDNAEWQPFFTSKIGFHIFEGPVSKLTKDVRATLTIAQTNAALVLNPLFYYDNSPLYMTPASWTDRMNAYNATQASAGFKPTLATGEINGRPALVFDGNDTLTREKFTQLQGVPAVVVWWAGKDFTFSQDDGTNTGRFSIQQTGGTTFILVDGVNGIATYTNSSDYNWVVLVYDGTLTGNANRLKAYSSAGQITLSFGGTVPAVTGSNTSATFQIQRATGGGSAGRSAEGAAVVGTITPTELTNLRALLSMRYD